MKNGTCLKCSSKEVYTTKNGAQYSLGINEGWRPIMEFENYLCLECGYLETYYLFEYPEELIKKEKHKKMFEKSFKERLQGIKEDWKQVE